MAQKIFPRSLRTTHQSGAYFSFFTENAYADLWQKMFVASTELDVFDEKNLVYKKKRPGFSKKTKTKKQKMKTFYKSRFFVTNTTGTFRTFPILFKFAEQSLSYKYNPIKAMFKGRRSLKIAKKSYFYNKKKNFSIFYIFVFFLFKKFIFSSFKKFIFSSFKNMERWQSGLLRQLGRLVPF